ncbi:MAG TPA: polysaccharide deacetylase family protein [Gemmatimonadaceae bacterium]
MPASRWFALAFLALTAPLSAQTKTIAERLGYPAGTKLLILHADDLGVAHSVDSASLGALGSGAISSASVMMTTPWITEVAAYARAHPDADLGLHLTLTAEWATYRWGSVESRDQVASLLDSAGIFPNDVEPVMKKAKPAEVERELRAQVERALAMGIHPTHLDSHMGALFSTPELMAAYVKVAREYHLPFLAARAFPQWMSSSTLTERDVVPDAIVIASDDVPRDQWKAFYLKAVADLKPGLTELIVHLGFDDSELRAVTVNHEPYGSAWRQRDYEVVTSPEFRKALADNHVVLIGWKDLARAAGSR